MKIKSIFDKAFLRYGNVLENYNFSELFDELDKVTMPDSGIIYIASKSEFENVTEKKKIQSRGFGGIEIQIGCVCGYNNTLNCLEFHKSSEFNIAKDDIILVLGDVRDVENGIFNTEKCEAFFVPAGTGVELYGTTLHYAPFGKDNQGYKMLCVLPQGTNAPKIEFACQDFFDKMNGGINKWIMAHNEYQDASVFKGLIGKNIKLTDLEDN